MLRSASSGHTVFAPQRRIESAFRLAGKQPSWDTVDWVRPQHAGHETHRHPDRRGRYARLNATIHGAVVRANKLRIEMFGLIKGFNCLFNPRVPHVHLNPLFQEIPELDPTKGGTLIGSSRDYVDPDRDTSSTRSPNG